MAKINCCKDCPDRKIVDGVRCHSWCEKYAKENAENQKILTKAFYENDIRLYKDRSARKNSRRYRR